jgi:hypothetical protein
MIRKSSRLGAAHSAQEPQHSDPQGMVVPAVTLHHPTVRRVELQLRTATGVQALPLVKRAGNYVLEVPADSGALAALRGQHFPSAEAARQAVDRAWTHLQPQAARINRFAAEPSCASLTPHEFGLIVADPTLGSVPHDGASVQRMLTWFCAGLRDVSTRLPNASPQLLQQLQRARESLKAVLAQEGELVSASTLKTTQSRANHLLRMAAFQAQRIRRLPPGGFLLMSGGWGHPVCGHFMLYQVSRSNLNPEMTSLEVFNTGSGVQMHQGAIAADGRKYKYAGSRTYTDIPLAAWGTAEHPGVPLIALVEAKLAPIWDERNEVSAKLLYEQVFASLGGRVQPEDAGAMPERFITGQRSASCTYQTLENYLRFAITGDYKEIKFLLRILALHEGRRLAQQGLAPGHTDAIVLKEGTQNLQRAAIKAHQRGTFNFSDLADIAATLSAQPLAPAHNTTGTLPDPQPWAAAQTVPELRCKVPLVPTPVPSAPPDAYTEPPAPTAAVPQLLFVRLEVPQSLRSYCTALSQLKTCAAAYLKRGDNEATRLCIDQIFVDPQWQSPPLLGAAQDAAEARTALNKLFEVSQLYYSAIRGHGSHEASCMATLLSLGAAADRLTRHALGDMLEGWYLPWLEQLPGCMGPEEILAPAQAMALQQAAQYFQSVATGQCLQAPELADGLTLEYVLTETSSEFKFYAEMLRRDSGLSKQIKAQLNAAHRPTALSDQVTVLATHSYGIKQVAGPTSLQPLAQARSLLWMVKFYQTFPPKNLPASHRVAQLTACAAVHTVPGKAPHYSLCERQMQRATGHTVHSAPRGPKEESIQETANKFQRSSRTELAQLLSKENQVLLETVVQDGKRLDYRQKILVSNTPLQLHALLTDLELNPAVLSESRIAEEFLKVLHARSLDTQRRLHFQLVEELQRSAALAGRLRQFLQSAYALSVQHETQVELLSHCVLVGARLREFNRTFELQHAWPSAAATLDLALGRDLPPAKRNALLLATVIVEADGGHAAPNQLLRAVCALVEAQLQVSLAIQENKLLETAADAAYLRVLYQLAPKLKDTAFVNSLAEAVHSVVAPYAPDPTAAPSLCARTASLSVGGLRVCLLTGQCRLNGVPVSRAFIYNTELRGALYDLIGDASPVPRLGADCLRLADHPDVKLLSGSGPSTGRRHAYVAVERTFIVDGQRVRCTTLGPSQLRNMPQGFLRSLIDQKLQAGATNGACCTYRAWVAPPLSQHAWYYLLTDGNNVPQFVAALHTNAWVCHSLTQRGWQLQQAQHHPALAQFSQRAPPRCLVNDDRQVVRLEVPELDLVFHLDALGRARWSLDPDFALDPQPPTVFGSWGVCLQLTHVSGTQRRLVVPFGGAVELSASKNFNRADPHATPLIWEAGHTGDTKAFIADLDTEGTIHCLHSAEHLQLAYYYLLTRQFEAANECLQAAVTEDPFDTQSKRLFTFFFGRCAGLAFGDAGAAAVRCRALLVMLCNPCAESWPVQKPNATLATFWHTYLSGLGNIACVLHLSHPEEERLSKYFGAALDFAPRADARRGLCTGRYTTTALNVPQPALPQTAGETELSNEPLVWASRRVIFPERLPALHVADYAAFAAASTTSASALADLRLRLRCAADSCVGFGQGHASRLSALQALGCVADNRPVTLSFLRLASPPQQGTQTLSALHASADSPVALPGPIRFDQSVKAKMQHHVARRPVTLPTFSLSLNAQDTALQAEIISTQLTQQTRVQLSRSGALLGKQMVTGCLALPLDEAQIRAELVTLCRDSAYKTFAAQVLQSANLRPAPEDNLVQTLGAAGGSAQVITEAVLQEALATNQWQILSLLNPSLLGRRLEALRQQFIDCLLRKSCAQHAERALLLLQECGAGPAVTAPAGQLQAAALAEALGAQRHYDVDRHPDYLVFETTHNLLLSRQQVLTLAALGPNAHGEFYERMVQLRGGAGKTSVLLPLLAQQKADGSHLSIIVLPQAQFFSNRRDLERTPLGKHRERRLSFLFKRCSDSGVNALQVHLKNFQRCIAERCSVLTTRQSLQSFVLHHRELIERLHTAAPQQTDFVELTTRIELMARILLLVRERGVAQIDEIDQVLDARSVLNFACGAPEAMQPQRRELVLEVYTALVQETCDLQDNVQSSLDLTPQLQRRLAQHCLQSMPEFVALEAPLRDTIVHYTLETGGQLPVWLSRLGSAQPAVADLVVLLKEILQTTLPATLRRHGGEHYGRAQADGACVAVPLYRGTPVPGSEFSNCYETLHYTCQLYLHHSHGVQIGEARSLIQICCERAAQEALHERLEHDATQSIVLLKSFMPAPFAALPIAHLLHDKDALAERIVDHLRATPLSMLNYVRHFVAPQVQVIGRQLTATAHSFVDTFAVVQGFTGTPWNHLSLPKRLSLYHDATDDVQVERTLFDPAKTSVLELGCTLPESLLAQVAQHSGLKDVSALIDAGALCKGFDGATVARRLEPVLRQHAPHLRAVRFFDEGAKHWAVWIFAQQQQSVLRDTHAGSLRAWGLAADQVFDYYDQARSTGADVAQPPLACGLVTVGALTLLRDVQQGALRMRALCRGQRCMLLAPQALFKGQVTVESLYRLAVNNQAEHLGRDKLMAFKQSLQGRVEALWSQHTLQLPAYAQASVWSCFVPLLVTQLRDAPFEQLAAVKNLEISEAMQSFCQDLAQRLDWALDGLRGLRGLARALPMLVADLQDLQATVMSKSWQQVQQRALGALPPTCRAGAVAGPSLVQDMQQEVQREVAVQAHSEQASAALRLRYRQIGVSQPQQPVPLDAPAVAFYDQFRAVRSCRGGELFDPHLFASSSFLHSLVGEPEQVLHAAQKPIYFFLAAQECQPTAAPPLFLLLTLSEAQIYLQELDAAAAATAYWPRQIWLCNRHGEPVRSSHPATAAALCQSETFARMLMQIKLLDHAYAPAHSLTQRDRRQFNAWMAQHSQHDQQGFFAHFGGRSKFQSYYGCG